MLQNKNIMFILSSPSGAGKSSLANKLQATEKNLTISVSFTTREKRVGEIEGKDYYFVSRQKFEDMIDSDEFIEYATVYDNYYGTPKKNTSYGQDIIFDVDWRGAESLRKKMSGEVVSIYILPPSIEELDKRLRGRNQDSEEIIKKRMSQAKSEMAHYSEYDYVVINDDFDDSLLKLNSIILAERLKKDRQDGLSSYVQKLINN